MSKFEILIASLPYREELVAEIYYNRDQWVEISQEKEGELIVQFYSPSDKKYWEFQLDEAIEVLKNAQKKLLGMGNKNR
jgi:hypothetical protein